jgi:hypothetical protein
MRISSVQPKSARTLPFLCKLRDYAPIDALQDRVPIGSAQVPALVDALQDRVLIEPPQEETKEGRDGERVEKFLIRIGKRVSLPVQFSPFNILFRRVWGLLQS